MSRVHILALLGCLFLGATTPAAWSQERHRLYTVVSPADTGGIKGEIVSPAKPILQILAMPPEEPRFVYQGKITGDNKQGFLFENLPMAVYDLLVIYDSAFYEGLELHPKENTLTPEDLKKINDIITQSEPYFTRKIIHRVEGTTGRGNFSRCICTFLRDTISTGTASHREGFEYMVDQSHLGLRRTFKLIWLKDVGPGWQVVQARDLYPVWTTAKFALPTHNYTTALSHIRVTETIKDIGKLAIDSARP